MTSTASMISIIAKDVISFTTRRKRWSGATSPVASISSRRIFHHSSSLITLDHFVRSAVNALKHDVTFIEFNFRDLLRKFVFRFLWICRSACREVLDHVVASIIATTPRGKYFRS